jgi:hypothetical protein
MFRILFLVLFFPFLVDSIGYYERNIARKFYWLLENNLYRLNGTDQHAFWAIVDNDQLTKKEILQELRKWAETKDPYFIVSLWNK